jgi:hypothetical protein
MVGVTVAVDVATDSVVTLTTTVSSAECFFYSLKDSPVGISAVTVSVTSCVTPTTVVTVVGRHFGVLAPHVVTVTILVTTGRRLIYALQKSHCFLERRRDTKFPLPSHHQFPLLLSVALCCSLRKSTYRRNHSRNCKNNPVSRQLLVRARGRRPRSRGYTQPSSPGRCYRSSLLPRKNCNSAAAAGWSKEGICCKPLRLCGRCVLPMAAVFG